MTGVVLVDRADHEVRRWAPGSRSPRWPGSTCSCWRSSGTTTTSPRSSTPTESTTVLPSRNHAIVLVAQLHRPTHAGDRLRPRDAAGRAGGRDGQRRRRRHPPARARVGPAQDPGVAQGRRVALPGDHQAGAGLRQAGAHEEPARRRHGVRPRVRRRALVGAGAAQPERAADQDPPAVPAGGDGGIGAMAAEVVRADRGTGRADPGRLPPGLPDRRRATTGPPRRRRPRRAARSPGRPEEQTTDGRGADRAGAGTPQP